LNPFQSARGRKHDISDGKTPGLSIQQARDLLGSIDTSHVVGLRDRALLGTFAYTGARIGAIARLCRGDLQEQGTQRVLRFREKGGKQREIPVRHDLDRWLGDYLKAAGIDADPKETPLSRAALGNRKALSDGPLAANDMRRLLKRRMKDAGLPPILNPQPS
jgi:integrase